MNSVSVDKFGELYAPQSLSDLVLLLEHYARAGRKVLAWRGQANIDWGIDCTATRRIRDFLPEENKAHDELDGTVLEYERRLLDDARMVGYGFRDGRKLSDLELLSVMRHHGAATRLMDFTKNAFVALWFATQANEKGYGLLVGIDPRSESLSPVRTEQHLDKSLKTLLEDKALRDKYVVWEPRHLFERMRVQQSLFLFGRVVPKDWGSAPFRVSHRESRKIPDEMILIAVPPSLKSQMLEDNGYTANWESVFGYNTRYLFPDLAGYADANSAGSKFPGSFFADPRFEGKTFGWSFDLEEE